MPLINFPMVLNFAGVPPLARDPLKTYTPSLVLGTVAGALWQATVTRNMWGIYDADGIAIHGIDQDKFLNRTVSALRGGTQVSTISLDFTNENKIADYPIERGSFAQFNKVQTPNVYKVQMAIGGTEDDRRTFLRAIDAASYSLKLYSVVTPEEEYFNVTIKGYSYSRKAQDGAHFILVTLDLLEIREVSAQYTTATIAPAVKNKDDAAATTAGKVQGKNESIAQSLFNAAKDAVSGISAGLRNLLNK